MEDSSGNDPWASPGYTPPAATQPPSQPVAPQGYGQGYGAPGQEAPAPHYGAPSHTPGQSYASHPAPAPAPAPGPAYGAPGPGYEALGHRASQPQGTYTFPSLEKQPLEPLAVASLATSVIPPLGLGLGIVARRKIKKTFRRGKSLATAGIILSTITLIAAVLAVGTFVLDGTFARMNETPIAGDVPKARTGSPVNLDVGNCVVTLPVTPEVGEVALTPCATDHQLQVIAREPIGSSTYAGPEALHAEAARVCEAAFDALDSANAESGSFTPWHLVPSQENWDAGERNIICFARSTAGPVTVDLLS